MQIKQVKTELAELEEELAQESPVGRESGALQSQMSNMQVNTLPLAVYISYFLHVTDNRIKSLMYFSS